MALEYQDYYECKCQTADAHEEHLPQKVIYSDIFQDVVALIVYAAKISICFQLLLLLCVKDTKGCCRCDNLVPKRYIFKIILVF